MNKYIILIISLLFCFTSLEAEQSKNRGITSTSSSLINSSLVINRRKVRRGNLRFTFKLTVNHLTEDATCVHFLELIPVNLRGRELPETVVRRVGTTTESKIVLWRDVVRPTKRRRNRKSQIHARVSSSCTQNNITETINSNVASRYSCTRDRDGISPKRQVRRFKNARVRFRNP